MFRTSYSHNSVITVLQCCDKSHEGFSSFRCAFVYTGIFEYMYKHIADLFPENLMDVVLVDVLVFREHFCRPCRMFLDLFV